MSTLLVQFTRSSQFWPRWMLILLGLASCESTPSLTRHAASPHSETSQKAQPMSATELVEMRRKAGFKDSNDILTDSANLREKDARQYIKTRMPEYRKLLADFQRNVDSIAQISQTWPKAQNPQRAFDRWFKPHMRKSQKLTDRYTILTNQETQGGATQLIFGRSVHTWENLNNDLSPDISQNVRFYSLLQEINRGFSEVEAALNDIDQDESLVVNRFYQVKQTNEPKK